MDLIKLLAGKYLLKDELPLEKTHIQQLLDKKFLIQSQAISKTFFHTICNRCGNKKQYLFGTMNCSQCQETHVYCRNCIETGRAMECSRMYEWTGPEPTWLEQKNPCRWEGELTPAQTKAAEKIKQTTIQNKEILIWAVCGAGKTEMLFPGITTALQQGKRVCLATPRSDVVRELMPRFRSAFPQTDIEALYANSKQKTGIGQLILSTTHQLIRYKHAFDVMIIDEIDAFPFHQDPSLHRLADRACKPTSSRIYLTATPRKQLKKKVQQKTLPTAFVPIRFHGYPLPVPIPKLEWNLRKKITQKQVPSTLSSFLKLRNHKRQLLIFVPTVHQLSYVEDLLKEYFSSLTTVHAEDEDRKEKIEAFRAKKYKAMVTTTILERGVTFPSVDVVILDAGHHVFDEAAIVQIAGRAGRSHADPTGDVFLIHQGLTEAIKQAIRHIESMNKRAKNESTYQPIFTEEK